MATLMPYLLVGLGGFIGANARFVVARLVGALFETRFPLGTFVINVSGSFLLGVLGTLVAQKVMPNSESMRLALGVGFLGAFTTFSTFEFETHALLRRRLVADRDHEHVREPVRGASCRPRGHRGRKDLADVRTRDED